MLYLLGIGSIDFESLIIKKKRGKYNYSHRKWRFFLFSVQFLLTLDFKEDLRGCWRTEEDERGLERKLEDLGGLKRTKEDAGGLGRTKEETRGLKRTEEDLRGS